MLKRETQEAISEALRLVASAPIPTSWRTSQPYPGGGVRKSRARGSAGFDLAARLEYEPGDPIRDIDWPASAQTGLQSVLVTHRYEPRDLKVFILADVQPTMDFGTFRTTKRLLAVELAASIIKSAGKTDDKVGFIAYSERNVETYLTPRSVKRILFPALVSLIEAGNTPRANENETSGLVRALSTLPARRSLVFILSDFLTLDDEGKEALRKAAQLHDVVCLAIQDRRERELPAGIRIFGVEVGGIYTLRDLRTGQRKSLWLSRKTREAFAENFRRHQEALEDFFKKSHCDFGVFSTEEGVAMLPKIVGLFSSHRR